MVDNRFHACLLLHALGDTIGFKNGDWEFNYHIPKVDYTFTLEIVFEFFSLGGINGINLKGWIVSDDTLFHLKTAIALIKESNDVNNFAETVTLEYIDALDKMKNEKRYPGVATVDNLQDIKNITDRKWFNTPYNFHFGGCGAAMRTPCIGLILFGKHNRQKLIAFAMEASRNTHNSAVGYLGGITAALFTAFAMEKIAIKRWAFELLDILKPDGLVEQYIKNTFGFDDYLKDKDTFIDKWKQFVNDRFVNGEPVYPKTFNHPEFRSLYYGENFGFHLMNNTFNLPGSGGDDCTIIAYDTLLNCNGFWEKAVIFGMLHVGDSDTTGCLVGAWYGAVYGFGDVPDSNLKYLEFKTEIEKLAETLSSI